MKNNALLIIAISARPYVEAANKAGFCVTAIDGYLDQETVNAATQAFAVAISDVGFSEDALMSVIHGLNIEQYIGYVVGSGFEMQPALLSRISMYLPLLGNAETVVQHVKTPSLFFQTLDALNVRYPAIQSDVALGAKAVVKTVGGSGGQHIVWREECAVVLSDHTTRQTPSHYHQTYIEGLSVSVLFLAGIKVGDVPAPVVTVGFNEQWVNACEMQPFRFGGLVSYAAFTDQIQSKLKALVLDIAYAFDLIGLNSLDVLISDGQIYVLEVNPRLSASLELYLQDCLDCYQVNLMQEHVNLCNVAQQENKKQLVEINQRMRVMASRPSIHAKRSKGIGIVYAEKDCTFSQDFKWPSWVMDKSQVTDNTNTDMQAVAFKKGAPICSVHAIEKSAAETKKIIKERVRYILACVD